MLGSEWLYGAIALLVGVHVLTLLYAYRRQGDPTATGDAEGTVDAERTSAGSDDGPDVVQCANCGTRNDNGYKFCRECVGDLSTGATGHYTATTPDTH
jgi:hypothetical protein